MENFKGALETTEKSAPPAALDYYKQNFSKLNTTPQKSDTSSNPSELVFTPINGFDSSRRPGDLLIASRQGDQAFSESQRVYDRALADMRRDGHHLSGGDLASSVGNILQNSGLSNKTWVCAEQAEYLARQLRDDPALSNSRVYLIHTPDYEHLFVGLQDPDGRMIYMDPWREIGPSRSSPNQIEGSVEYR